MSKHKFEVCTACGTPLLQRGGYGGTGLCGPCCTGEADTVDEITPDPQPEPEGAPDAERK